ncbi:MAG: methyl-accepting chemotaxis protein [Myxococcota bacterium]
MASNETELRERDFSPATEAERLGQLSSILSDTVGNLQTTILALSNSAQSQRQEMQRLIEAKDGEQEGELDFRRFLDHTAKFMGTFGDLILHFSTHSIEVAYRVDDMVTHLDSIFAVLERIEGISDDSRVLAVNAAIEAARAGAEGRAFQLVAESIKSLATEVDSLKDEISNHTSEARTSIDTVWSLIAAMASHDMSDAVKVQKNVGSMVELLEQTSDKLEAARAHADQYTAEVEKGASDAIRLLQFEDMCRQLIEQVRGSLDRLDAELAIGPVLIQRGEAEISRSPVEQWDLDEGTAELF